MSKVPVLTVRRHPEESARSGGFWERNHLHALASEEWAEHKEVWIADDEEHVVADTPAIRKAIKRARLIEVVKEKKATKPPKDEPPKGEESDSGESTDKESSVDVEVAATDAAKLLAADAGLDLVDIPPTGASGQVTKPDVEKAIQRAKDAEA